MTALLLPLIPGPMQIVLVVVVILLLFGGKKIPELMKGIGSGIKEFKNATKEEEDDTVDPKIENKEDK
jgi:sec-independent protein translocase protein TatA